MRILVYTNLFPNPAMPRHGLFVAERLRHLLATGEINASVVAPVPWFPSGFAGFGRYATLARVPAESQFEQVRVRHPRYPVIPKVGMTLAPWSQARFTRAAVSDALTDGPRPALIDAHYLYPDGVAAVRIGARVGLPVVLTARGSDVNVIAAGHAGPRRLILQAIDAAAAVVTVSGALRTALLELGASPEKIRVLRNGVDLRRFDILVRDPLPSTPVAAGVNLLSVGNLVPGKGHRLALAILQRMPEARLRIAGSGPLRRELESTARALRVSARLEMLGSVTQEQLKIHYNAADLLLHASAREGMPNVVLEALACGTPVVATRTGGIPEVVSDPVAGWLVWPRSPDNFVTAIGAALAAPPSRQAVRRHAEQFSWEATTRGQADLFRQVADSQEHPAS